MLLTQVIDFTVRKLKAQTANALTLLNLSLGGFAIINIIEGQLQLGSLLIFLAALADRFDGMVARKLSIESELGKQLDSMCDLISFGVAPALLIYLGVIHEFGAPAMFFTVFYIASGSFRLARFNVTENDGYFSGLPITAAGCFATLLFIVHPYVAPQTILFLMIFLSFMMISSFRLKKV
ncbi:CDP-diacylglycerol--serine O-phosphatidyltransferase [Bacillus sp. 2205SS5-2]|uniref:CDP-diacylglycerol--serine O-phosphatidyltransferase n=1 Tax=Bacillus sp. 2205SS5-2 TaxID=3109031 RepID=UPI003003BE2F